MASWEGPIETGDVPETGSTFDVIVVGGGPGGCSAAGYLSMAGKKVLLIEKGVWPRDKICGDAVGGKSLSHVRALGVKETLESTPHFRVNGILFSSPNGKEVRVPLPEEDVARLEAGYALPRQQFDHLLFDRVQELVREKGGSVVQGASVKDVLYNNGNDPGEGSGSKREATGVRLTIGGRKGDVMEFHAPAIVGAGGYLCPVATSLVVDTYQEIMVNRKHYCGGYREYWDGVVGCEGNIGDIEIHFVDTIIPGYFWIFPIGEGRVNVGCGMVMHLMDKQSKKLKALQADIIANHPQFKERFANATMVKGSAKGWQLPFGSPRKKAPSFQPRRAAMAGAMCIGDAASLVDPFTGEGIGNALLSAKLASLEFDLEKHKEGFTAESADSYQVKLWGELSAELTNSYKLQRLVKRKRLMNFFIGKAVKKVELQHALTDMIASKEAQGQFHSKWWMIKTLLF